MSSLLRAIEFLSLSVWLGSDVFLSFVVAPGAFRILSTRDQAGAMVGYALGAMHIGGVICGLVLVLARIARTKTFASLLTPVALCVLAMIALTAISQFTVSPKMARAMERCSCETTCEVAVGISNRFAAILSIENPRPSCYK